MLHRNWPFSGSFRKQEPEVHTTAMEWALSGGMYTSHKLSSTSISSISHYPFCTTPFWLPRTQQCTHKSVCIHKKLFCSTKCNIFTIIKTLDQEGHASQVLQYYPRYVSTLKRECSSILYVGLLTGLTSAMTCDWIHSRFNRRTKQL